MLLIKSTDAAAATEPMIYIPDSRPDPISNLSTHTHAHVQIDDAQRENPQVKAVLSLTASRLGYFSRHELRYM